MASVLSFFQPVSQSEYEATFASTSQEIAVAKTKTKHVTKIKVGRPRNSIFSPPSSPTNSVVSSSSALSSNSSSLSSSSSKRPSTYINWFQPHLIKQIEYAVKHKRFFVDALAYLQTDSTFQGMSLQNLRRWFNPKTLLLNEKYDARKKENAARFIPLKMTGNNKPGRISLLTPTTLTNIDTTLRAMRTATLSLNVFIMSPIVRGIIAEHQPEILIENGGRFKVSDSWMRKFVRKRLNWSYRKHTRATRARPFDWEKRVHEMLMRAAILINVHGIPPEMFINFDQTGIHLVPNGGEKTYEQKGAQDIDIAGSEDKRQITVVVASTAAGALLPLQLVFEGKTSSSLPTKTASAEAVAAGFDMTFSHNHWSTYDTMVQYMNNIIAKYVSHTREQLGLSDTSKVVLLMDVWTVHRGKEFRAFLSKHYPYIIPLFIPAGCTGEAQPADITIQRQIKIHYKREFQKWLTGWTLTQLKTGLGPTDIVKQFDFSLPTLRNLIPGWLLTAYHHVKSTDCVLRGWNAAGLLDMWDETCQAAALRHHVTEPLFKPDFSYTLPTTVKKEQSTFIPKTNVYDEDEEDGAHDGYLTETDEESVSWEEQQRRDEHAREQKQEQEQEQIISYNQQEEEAAQILLLSSTTSTSSSPTASTSTSTSTSRPRRLNVGTKRRRIE